MKDSLYWESYTSSSINVDDKILMANYNSNIFEFDFKNNITNFMVNCIGGNLI